MDKRRMKRLFITSVLLLPIMLQSQTIWQTVVYDQSDEVGLTHVTQMLRDSIGFLWLSTWNGLYRFDGYSFVNFKARVGDGNDIPSDRIRDIFLCQKGEILCKIDDKWYRFSPKTAHFSPLNDSENATLHLTLPHRQSKIDSKNDTARITLVDTQGILWQYGGTELKKTSTYEQQYKPLQREHPSHIRALLKDSKGRLWAASRDDKSIAIYSSKDSLLGYITSNGKVTSQYTSFEHAVYHFIEDKKARVWAGTRDDGLYLFVPQGNSFEVKHYDIPNCNSIYDIEQDIYGRLWIATLGGGISCLIGDTIVQIAATKQWRVRKILITKKGAFIATTTEGLAIGQLPKAQNENKKHANQNSEKEISSIVSTQFCLHKRLPYSEKSLSNNATMDLLEASNGNIFITTESQGVDEIRANEIFFNEPHFIHHNTTNGLSTDITTAIIQYDGIIWITSPDRLIAYDPENNTYETYGRDFFHREIHFSEAQPIDCGNGKWLFATLEEAIPIDISNIKVQTNNPYLAITSIKKGNNAPDFTADKSDTIILKKQERNLTITFAALDFRQSKSIKYYFRFLEDSIWTLANPENHSITLHEIKPGTHILQLKSTDAEGINTNNLRTITIIAKPKFSETTIAKLLLILIIIATTAIITYTIIYIQRLKQKQKDILKAYLSLINTVEENKQQHNNNVIPDNKPIYLTKLSLADDMFMKHIIDFIEKHIADQNVTITDMADASATSISALNRKLKRIVGLTPADFLRKARIQRACLLLEETNQTVSDITYNCGFNDPKYFGITFRKFTGMSPSDYRKKHT